MHTLIDMKSTLYRQFGQLAEADGEDARRLLDTVFSADCQWRVAHPINEFTGQDAAMEKLFRPLKSAMPDLERRDLIFVGGEYEGRTLIAALGHYCGTFTNDWLTIPATGRPIYIRYGEIYQVENGKVIQANLLWDILDVIRQAGFWPLAPSLGTEEMWPGPLTCDGIVLHETDPDMSAASIAQTLAMHRTLAEHDDVHDLTRNALLTMPQRAHWHPKMMWYGPAGIGTTRGLQGFVDYHQLPFRIAFRRPQGTFEEVMAERKRHGAGHYIRIGDGPYSVTGGWPSVYAVNIGGGFCGTTPTGRPVTMRVMDFYLHHEGLIRENWVPLDMLDLFKQMGIDIMDRMQSHFARGRLAD